MTDCTGAPTCLATSHLITCEGSPAGWLDWLLGLDRENQLIVIGRVREWRAVYRDQQVPPCPYCGERGQHLASCRHAGNDSLPVAGPVTQVWERRLVGTDVPEMLLHLVADGTGRVSVHEAVLGQLLLDAGWERTA